MATTIYKGKRVIYRVEKNDDGTLAVYREYSSTKNQGFWRKDGRLANDAGLMIKNAGGINAFLQKCEEVEDMARFVHDLNVEKKAIRERALQQRAEQTAQREAQAKADYERLFGGEVTESNEETVGALLRYLNTQNWGLWRLPKMTIGYQCNQYDCDGKQATTIKLDQPIVVNDVPGTMFEVGAPMGHLTKYRRI